MKEYPHARTNEEVIFNNMLRSARNPIKCAFGRLKARWQILNKRIDMGLVFVPSVVYACFVLPNFCEMQNMIIEDDAVAWQVACDRLQPEDASDCLYSFNSADGAHVRNITTQFYKEYIPH